MASRRNANETANEMTDLTDVAEKNPPLSDNTESNVIIVQEGKQDNEDKMVEGKSNVKYTIDKSENLTETGIAMAEPKTAEEDEAHMHIEDDVVIIEGGNGKDKFLTVQRDTGML